MKLYSARIRLPVAWRDVAEAHGINLSDLARQALLREFRRRKIAVPDMPEIKPGRPAATPADKG